MSIIFSVSFAFLGAVTASFIGVLSERIYTGQSWSNARSKCNSCRETLSAKDLLPILSWVIYRGRCRMCKSAVPIRYAFTEAILATLFVYSFIHFGWTKELFLFLCSLATLLFIVLYDVRHTVVPRGSSMLLILFGILFSVAVSQTTSSLGYVFGIAGIISLFFILLHVLSSGRAMGLGDAPVALALSLLVGEQAIAGLLFSFWIGALFGIILLLTRRGGPTMGIEVPFVPFMAGGYLLAYITQWNPLLF